MAADVMEPCVARMSAAIVLTIQAVWVPFHWGGGLNHLRHLRFEKW